jgi:hypothetical protein
MLLGRGETWGGGVWVVWHPQNTNHLDWQGESSGLKWLNVELLSNLQGFQRELNRFINLNFTDIGPKIRVSPMFWQKIVPKNVFDP